MRKRIRALLDNAAALYVCRNAQYCITLDDLLNVVSAFRQESLHSAAWLLSPRSLKVFRVLSENHQDRFPFGIPAYCVVDLPRIGKGEAILIDMEAYAFSDEFPPIKIVSPETSVSSLVILSD